jgi:hypothetical protein
VAQEAAADSAAEAAREVAPEEKSAATEARAPEVASAIEDLDSTPPDPPAAADKPELAAAREAPAPHGGGGKRLVKAVGRFLHIGGKKDNAAQAAH